MRLVIAGASLAGLRAAAAARAAGHDGELVLVGAEPHKPYTRPPLSKGVLHGAETVESCVLPGVDDLDAEWRLGVAATGLDVEGHVLRTSEGDVGFDRLIVATGCRARPWPGEALGGVVTLRSHDDAVALRDALAAGPRVVVVGAGFVGSEVAASCTKLGLGVTLVDVLDAPMAGLGERVSSYVTALHERHGVTLRLGAGVRALAPAAAAGQESTSRRQGIKKSTAAAGVAGVELEDGETLPADLVVVALGALPNTEWLTGSGLDVANGVRCDATLSAAPDVLAAGDVATWPHPLADGDLVRVEHWTHASESGTLAGRNALLDPAERKPYVAVPSFWSDLHDLRVQAVGLPRLAPPVHVVEDDGAGRWVAVGERDGRVLAAAGIDAARRLPAYRRWIGAGISLDDLRDAVAADPKALGTPVAA